MVEKEFELVSDTLKHVTEALSKNLMGLDYVVVCASAMEVLDKLCEEQCSLPVDVEKIVKNLGIDVIHQTLNIEEGIEGEYRYIHKMVGTFFKVSDSINCILLDVDSNSDETRYALSHELAHCLIHSSDRKFCSAYHVLPMLFKNMEEMIADIFAIFLLIPLPAFLNVFNEYISIQSAPVKTADWLKYLSIVAHVPYENVAIGYQNIRYVFGVIYQIKHEENGLEKFKQRVVDDMKEKIGEEKAAEVGAMVERQLIKVMDQMTEEMESRLYV